MSGPFDSYAAVTVGETLPVDSYEVPVDPMDDLQCESCQ